MLLCSICVILTLLGIPEEIFTLEIGLQVFKSEVIVPIVLKYLFNISGVKDFGTLDLFCLEGNKVLSVSQSFLELGQFNISFL